MLKISVIIPVYNAEQYLEECLNKKDKINELKQEISLLKEQLKQRKKTGKMEKKLFDIFVFSK